ncbi:MAG TPA: BON domain-containing protein [Bryobacteraceae bacterium]|jgi:osmotically-inducible protein OsmY|nr:BON domain-containing protein [Bryobacteraceae bacterium]HXJ38554.1 BON domain-containing protein [Bryobacteraceae bacterium]
MKNDVHLKNDVEQELRWDPSVHAEQIGVSVKNGVVELDGHVDSYYEKWAAERVVMRVAAVKAVASELKVELPASGSRTDEDIARTAMNHLEWNYSVPGTVKVKVTKGSVTLQGTAEWQYQREEAERAVRSLMGVKGVFNEITLKPRVSAERVKAKIEEALKRNAEIDASHIRVETSNGTVILHGDVRSWAEREEAERAAYAAPGVTKVEDQITIR